MLGNVKLAYQVLQRLKHRPLAGHVEQKFRTVSAELRDRANQIVQPHAGDNAANREQDGTVGGPAQGCSWRLLADGRMEALKIHRSGDDPDLGTRDTVVTRQHVSKGGGQRNQEVGAAIHGRFEPHLRCYAHSARPLHP